MRHIWQRDIGLTQKYEFKRFEVASPEATGERQGEGREERVSLFSVENRGVSTIQECVGHVPKKAEQEQSER